MWLQPICPVSVFQWCYLCSVWVVSGIRGRRQASPSAWRLNGLADNEWIKVGRGCCRCGKDKSNSWTESARTWAQPSWQPTPPHGCWERYSSVRTQLFRVVRRWIWLQDADVFNNRRALTTLTHLKPVRKPQPVPEGGCRPKVDTLWATWWLCVLCFFQLFCAQVYNQCKSSDEKVLLLSNLLIRRGAGITSSTRRVGPELSKRLYLTMNSCDPEQVLESNPWLTAELSSLFLCKLKL